MDGGNHKTKRAAPARTTRYGATTHADHSRPEGTIQALRTAGAAGLDHYRRLFGSPRYGRKVDRNSLPSPLTYLCERVGLRTTPRRAWASIRCPVHKNGDERNPSMRVSLVDGHFRCMTCGASGGDIIALHRLVSGFSSVEAVLDLGGRFHD